MLEETSGGEGCGFVNLTAVACADVGCDIRGHARPPCVARDDLECGVLPLVTSVWSVVSLMEDGLAEGGVVGDAEAMSVVPKSLILA